MMSSSKSIALEQCGRNKGYMEKDLSGVHPQGGCCLLEGPERMESVVNMKSVCKNISKLGVDVIHSRDAGRTVGSILMGKPIKIVNILQGIFVTIPITCRTTDREEQYLSIATIIYNLDSAETGSIMASDYSRDAKTSCFGNFHLTEILI
ncbi:pyroglutamyl-peptidase 1 [Pelobates cultripes]|uniref:Pyroglutamyl-peptidase 1 n=1 Tax=Pelobates cultripes TaxID=61616 RepID=A0AAD1RNB8_PELCU|nr:pyroglutamyl-peptidase 1 [Pelobates cultripes]